MKQVNDDNFNISATTTTTTTSNSTSAGDSQQQEESKILYLCKRDSTRQMKCLKRCSNGYYWDGEIATSTLQK